MLTEATFREKLNQLEADAENSTYLLAVSGGADSMVLLNLFLKAGLKFHAAHVNYKLRGEDSDADQRLVEGFCTLNDITLHVYEVSVKDEKPEGSIQVWARDLRYRFFKEIKDSNGFNYLVTAHHLNDQLETFVINLSRAAGLQGLCAIPANKNGVIRPLLSFKKEEIYEFAKVENVTFREDLSNKKNDYQRNFIRNEIVPALNKMNPNFLQNFSKSLGYLKQTNDFVAQQILEIERRMITHRDGSIIIDKQNLREESDFVRFEILRKYGFEAGEEIKKILAAPKDKIFRSPTFILEVDRDFLIIKDQNPLESDLKNEEITVAESLPENRCINLKQIINKQKTSKKTQWEIDLSKISFPLKLRKKASGDLICPVGMSGRKTVAKFFKDEKLPTFAQQNIWLLTDGNNNVLGIVPLRQDRRFAAGEDCQNKILITL